MYIGQTSKTPQERAGSNGSNYKESRRFYNAIKKYGWHSFKLDILATVLTLEEANMVEMDMIERQKSRNPKYGYNIALGGDNKEMSDETKALISQKAKSRMANKTNNPMYGKKHSAESIKRMSELKMGKNNPMYGKKWTQEQYEKCYRGGFTYEWTPERRKVMSDRMLVTSEKWKKRVKCVEDNLSFNSLTDAAKHYGVNVSTLCGHLKGYQHTCKGKHFIYS